MKKLAVVSLSALAFAEVGAMDVVYRNDFTRRESAAAIPRLGEWHEAEPYSSTDTLIYPYVSESAGGNWLKVYPKWGCDIYGVCRMPGFAYWYTINVFADRPSQDGWFQPDFSRGTATSVNSGENTLYHHQAGILFEQGNPCFRFFYSTDTARRGYAFHSLHNLFTNGVLRMQVDVRAPRCWAASNKPVLAFPVFDKYMDIEAWDAANHPSECCPGAVGVRSGGDLRRAFPQYYDVREDATGTKTQLGNNYTGSGDTEKQVHWFRFVVDYDLDNARFSGTVASLSEFRLVDEFDTEPHPTFETATTTAKSETIPKKADKQPSALWVGCATNAQGQLTTDMTEFWKDRRGISGIGFAAGFTTTMSLQGTTIITNKVLFDNVRVSWKAPGTADFELAYENDFKTRRYRTLSYPSATVRDYAATASAVTTVDHFSDYPHPSCVGSDSSVKSPAYKIVPVTGSSSTYATTRQDIGRDGWRRLYFPLNGGNGHVFTVTDAHVDGAVHTMLQMSQQKTYACVGNLIGTKVTSGKVGLSVDAFLPLAVHDGDDDPYNAPNGDAGRIGIALGEEAMYTDIPANHLSHLAAACGFVRVAGEGVTNDVPYKIGADGTELSTEVPKRARWYRMKLSVDLDAKTYDAEIRSIGETTIAAAAEPEGAVVYSASAVPLAADVKDLSAFHLWGYGYGDTLIWNEKRRGAFTNLRVFRIGTEGEETPLYANDFETRRRWDVAVPTATSRLAYQYDRDDGPDNWIRRNGAGPEWGGALATVRDDGGNRFVSLGRDSGDGLKTQYTTSLGTNLTDEVVTVQADLRPPAWWTDQSGAFLVGIGNRTLEQSQVARSESGRVAQFGLAYCGPVETNATCHYGNVTPVAVGADGVVASETTVGAAAWYRMIAKLDLVKKTYSVRVYSKGEAHPSMDGSRGTLVTRLDDVPFMAEVGEGLSALDLFVCGAGQTVGETGLDPLQAAVDNLQVSVGKQGFLILYK